jgi:heme/copper-type cytochrome/quinol oxidase subunit 2
MLQNDRVVVRAAFAIGIVAAIAAAGIAVGYGFGTTVQVASLNTTVTSTVSASNSSEPYVLTLVVTTENFYNATFGDQPAFYVLGPNGLQSSAHITIPAHRLIKLVIINYDDGAANLSSPQYQSVAGTVNDQMMVLNNTMINSTMTASGIQIRGGENVTTLPADEIAHTFTIPSLGINVPIGPSSTTVVYFMVNTPGTYTWFCMTACGAGADGLEGAMATPGWMTGSLVAQ